MFQRVIAGLAILVLPAGVAMAQEVVRTEKADLKVETIAQGLEQPWGLAILPDGRFLVTEKAGRMRIVSADGTVSKPLDGLPKVDSRGQGGLLDVTLDPEFGKNRLVYFSFSEPGPGGNSTAAARGRLSDDETKLENVQVIFSQAPKLDSTMHYGSRLVFDGKGHLFVTMGERFKYDTRGQAQELNSDLGKVVRINPDGSAPQDNPFHDKAGARPEIWTLGHRNVQAAAIDPATGDLWTIEHGPMGGDELNHDLPGLNFGWPLVSFGQNYDGTPVGTGKQHMQGVTDPVYQWTPVIAPSGMIFYTGDAFPQWRGNILVGGLKTQTIVRLERAPDGSITHEERLLQGALGRIRDVVQGPKGEVYVITDAKNGRLVRITNY
ncbi:MAG: PQQ-dependent sugar dehydrogenase [Hyphomicrobiales bacterium]